MLIKEFLKHYFTANTLHGTHSPFVYNFYHKIFIEDKELPHFTKIEEQRSILKKNKSTIDFIYYGAKGNSNGEYKSVNINTIATKSLKRPKWGRALYRLVKLLKPKGVIELGTSFGITTSYLAQGSSQSQITTFDGSAQVLKVAETLWARLGLENIETILGNIDNTLPMFLANKDMVELVFIDANHQEEATIQYFELLLPLCNEESILIFDDIYWSRGMKNAWNYIKTHPDTYQTIDLFEIGLVFFRKGQEREHFKLKY